MVQKQSDSGQQGRFKSIVCVGNEDGYLGIAASKTKEVGPGIRKAIASAKMNYYPVKRGCGSWECNVVVIIVYLLKLRANQEVLRSN
jgi:small subunit ribosomal protein S5